MSVGWNGAAPTSFDDASDYDLGTKFHANADITISDIRIFGGNSGNMGGRTAHLFSAAGGILATIVLPNTLTPGWATYALSAPVDINVGTDFWVCYDAIGSYGLVNPGGYPVVSADGLVTATGAAFNNTPALFPDTSSAVFFGVDVQYTARAGNQRPVAGLTASANGLNASAVVTITDESPASCSVAVEWGDGATSSGIGPQTFAHTYAAAGTYAVMVTVTDVGGLTDSAAVPLAVTAPPGVMDPNAEQVAVRWLQGVSGITSGMVATTLPRDNSTWAASGFVRVDGIVGGEIDAETGYRSAVASLTLWAVTPTSGRPPWWKAARLGGLIIADCAPPVRGHRLLTIGTGYRNARVVGAVPLSDPRRVPSDPGAYAKYQMDVSLSWAIV